jgi:hypothetical protein
MRILVEATDEVGLSLDFTPEPAEMKKKETVDQIAEKIILAFLSALPVLGGVRSAR